MDLFDKGEPPKKPRRPRRVLMHVIDAGPAEWSDTHDMVRFKCPRCKRETGWHLERLASVRFGVPCPECNKITED